MSFKQYSTNDTLIIKGAAIILICLHNFFHWLPPSPGENEFLFFEENVGNLFSLLGEKPLEFINILFSYFGHFGVQMFLLISGYGLAMSMAKKERGWLPFFWERIKKLYPLLLVGLLFLFLTTIITYGRLFTDTEQTEMWYKIFFVHTLVPGSALTLNGPWWFFALILQLYILFPILYKLTQKFGWKTFVAVCLVSYTAIFIYKFHFDLFHGEMMMQNAIGHLPEFCLGILIATNNRPKLNYIWLIAAIAVFCIGNYNIYLYPFTFLAATVIMIFIYQGLKSIPVKKHILKKPLIYFGELSMAIFVVHGALRKPILSIGNIYDNAMWHLLAGLIFFVVVWLSAIAAKQAYELLLKPINNIHIRDCRASRIIGGIVQTGMILFLAMVMAYYTYTAIDIKHSDYISSGEITEAAVIGTDNTYTRITYFDIDKRYSNIQIEGSLEYKTTDITGNTIPIVIEMPGVLWEKIDLPAEYATNEYKEFHFSHRYIAPFVTNLNKIPIKIYFWNHNNESGEFRNAKVSISH